MKSYFLTFASGDPRTLSALSPTFLFFRKADGTSVIPPSISEVGTTTGVYTFSWGTTQAIAFLVDAATTSPGANARYIVGSIDPVDRVDELTAFIGSTASSFGNASTDPVDLFGYLKRIGELLQGDQQFNKGSPATLTQLDRTGGTTLYQKTISNNASLVIKS